jgi:response regulator RpfG family c-di-GMP phosphodiesterase
VADVFDVLPSAQIYRAAFRSEVARLMIQEDTAQYFDPVIVEAFLARFNDILKIRALPETHKNELTAELLSADA